MFCFKCGGITENEKCWSCNDNNSLNSNSLDLSPVCFGFLPMEPYGNIIEPEKYIKNKNQLIMAAVPVKQLKF